MAASRRLPRYVIAAAHAASILGVKAGARSEHRFTGVWPVVVNGRLYARSWTVKKGGWFEASQKYVRAFGPPAAARRPSSSSPGSVFVRPCRVAKHTLAVRRGRPIILAA